MLKLSSYYSANKDVTKAQWLGVNGPIKSYYAQLRDLCTFNLKLTQLGVNGATQPSWLLHHYGRLTTFSLQSQHARLRTEANASWLWLVVAALFDFKSTINGGPD